MFLTSHTPQIFAPISHQNISTFFLNNIPVIQLSLLIHSLISLQAFIILINISVKVLLVCFYKFTFSLLDYFHVCLHCPFYPLLAFPCWLLTHMSQERCGPSYALQELKRNKPKPLRIALLNRWQDCRKINKYGASKNWCIWGVSSSLGKAPNEMRQRKSWFQLNTDKCWVVQRSNTGRSVKYRTNVL